ncbi:MAG: TolB family protein [Gaiellaceae bacterium]
MRRGLLIAAGGLALAAATLTASGSAHTQARIVYRTVWLANPGKPPEVYSVLPSGGSRRLLARGAEQPAWSRDHRRVAFARGVVGREGIWVMNADGSAQRRLTTRPGDGDPAWSPDGRRIVFRRSVAGGFDLWIVPAAGGRASSLRRTPRGNELNPDWSPDGRRLAFQSNTGSRIELWVLNLASRKARRLTSGPPSFSPDWAPDSRRIAYATGGRIAVLNVDRPRPRLLPTGSPLSADSPAWSPEGTRIAFQRGGQVLTIRADGKDRRYVTRAAWGTNGEPGW